METTTPTPITPAPLDTPSTGNGKKFLIIGALVLALGGGAFFLTQGGATLKGSFVGGGTNCPTIAGSDIARATLLTPNETGKYILSVKYSDETSPNPLSITWSSTDLPSGAVIKSYLDNQAEVSGTTTCPFIFTATVKDTDANEIAQKKYYINPPATADGAKTYKPGDNVNQRELNTALAVATASVPATDMQLTGATATRTTTSAAPAATDTTRPATADTATLITPLLGTTATQFLVSLTAGPAFGKEVSKVEDGWEVLVPYTVISKKCAPINHLPNGKSNGQPADGKVQLGGNYCREWYRGTIKNISSNGSSTIIMQNPNGPWGKEVNADALGDVAFVSANPGWKFIKGLLEEVSKTEEKGISIIAESPNNPGKYYDATIQYVNDDGKTAYVTTNDDHTIYEKLPMSKIFAKGNVLDWKDAEWHQLKKFW